MDVNTTTDDTNVALCSLSSMSSSSSSTSSSSSSSSHSKNTKKTKKKSKTNQRSDENFVSLCRFLDQKSISTKDVPIIQKNEQISQEHIERYQSTGVALIQIFDQDELKRLSPDIIEMINDSPAFKQEIQTLNDFNFKGDDRNTHVMGGFGAWGNPTSFHYPTMQNIRMACYFNTLPFMSQFESFNKSDRQFCSIIDRFCVRVKNASLSSESEHRDTSPLGKKTDTIFGGWVNLSATNISQHFSCYLGTHFETAQMSDKDFKQSLREESGFNTLKLSKAQRSILRTHLSRVTIPAGYMILFHQNILHIVDGGKIKTTSPRLFTGWYLTHGQDALYPNGTAGLMNDIERGAPMVLKSNQTPPMHAKLHKVNYIENNSKHCVRVFTKPMLELVHFKPGAQFPKGKTLPFVKRVAPSLSDMDPSFDVNAYYTQDDIDILIPHPFK